ncbi:MAG: HD domain-containing protein [Nitrososphaerota archaeon]|nr:HD domain-containing protein [Nitrososphaerota archaeon]
MKLKPVGEIRDPVHGYIQLTDVEKQLIDSPFVQRLRKIHQLAGSYLVYPGATHTRFEHVIGTMHVAGLTAEALAQGAEMDPELVQEVRLAALLHDVGHGPFSHMYEDVLKGKSHEEISQRVIRETSVGDILDSYGFSPKKMSEFAVGRQRSRAPFMNEIIAGSLSADMMDYLPRDSYFTGVEYGKVDAQRVMNSLHVAAGHLVIDDAAVYAYEALLLARYEMFKAVYFHRTVRAAELMLARSMQLADGVLGLTDLKDLSRYLDLTDELVIHSLVTLEPSTPDLREARRLAVDFNDRRLVKCAFERVVQRKEEKVGLLFADESAREKTVAAIAEASGVDRGKLYLDVPTTPSVPYTYTKGVLKEVNLLKFEGNRKVVRAVPLSELSLVGSIAGFMDVLRVYTTQENRPAVEKATSKLFRDDGFVETLV